MLETLADVGIQSKPDLCGPCGGKKHDVLAKPCKNCCCFYCRTVPPFFVFFPQMLEWAITLRSK